MCSWKINDDDDDDLNTVIGPYNVFFKIGVHIQGGPKKLAHF